MSTQIDDLGGAENTGHLWLWARGSLRMHIDAHIIWNSFSGSVSADKLVVLLLYIFNLKDLTGSMHADVI